MSHPRRRYVAWQLVWVQTGNQLGWHRISQRAHTYDEALRRLEEIRREYGVTQTGAQGEAWDIEMPA